MRAGHRRPAAPGPSRLLGRDYWLILSTPAAGTDQAAIDARAGEHIGWLLGLERDGVLFLSGPAAVRPGHRARLRGDRAARRRRRRRPEPSRRTTRSFSQVCGPSPCTGGGSTRAASASGSRWAPRPTTGDSRAADREEAAMHRVGHDRPGQDGPADRPQPHGARLRGHRLPAQRLPRAGRRRRHRGRLGRPRWPPPPTCCCPSSPTPPPCEEVIAGPAGTLTALRPGTVHIEMSTIDVGPQDPAAGRGPGHAAATCSTARSAAAPGWSRRGGPPRSRPGDRASVDRVAPVLDAVSGPWVYTGEFGTGARMKYIANLLLAVHTVAAAEAIALARRSGLDLGAGAGAPWTARSPSRPSGSSAAR